MSGASGKGQFKPDTNLNDGVERYVTTTQQGQDMTSAPPAQEEEPTVWGYYNQRGENYDKDLVKDANNTVEVLLIFAGLFSAVVTAFISQTYPMMRMDPNDILLSIYQRERYPGTNTTLDQPFVAPPYAVRVNCFLFAGLFTSMLVAMLGILVKQWTRSYERELSGISSHHLRARTRHFRYSGAKKWHLASIVGLLSIFMHLALFISAVGIIDLLLATAPTVGYVAVSVFTLGVSFFLVTTMVPLLWHDAPFRSPLSRLLCGLKRKILRSRDTGRQRVKVPNEEAGLDDHVELSEDKGSEENSIVKADILLDLDILCHLLTHADKSTDRWLLDLCFAKLPRLTLIEKDHRDAFTRRNVIIEIYMFLAKGCLKWKETKDGEEVKDGKTGKYQIASERLKRAKELCRFLGWYLLLPSTPEERKVVQNIFTKNGDPLMLPRTLAKDTDEASLLLAYPALGAWEHLVQEEQSPGECVGCHAEVERLSELVKNTSPTASEEAEKISLITSILLKQTNCLISSGRNRTMTSENIKSRSNATLNLLQNAFKCVTPTTKQKKSWLDTLSERETKASTELKEIWFKVLTEGLRTVSVGSNTSLTPLVSPTASRPSSPPVGNLTAQNGMHRSPSPFGRGSIPPMQQGPPASGSRTSSNPPPSVTFAQEAQVIPPAVGST